MDKDGKVLARGKVATDPEALFEALKEHCLCPERIVMETGTLSHWLVRELRALGLPVEMIDARTGFCRPVAVKGEDAQGDRIVLKARSRLVGQRRDMENAIRGLLASLGHRFPKGVGKFARRVRAILAAHPELSAAIEPLLHARAALEVSRGRLDKEVGRRARGNPACRLLMTAPGVGSVTARRYQSGEMDYSGRISKHGDAMLRALLYEAANSMLTVVRRAHPLKDWARRIKKRSSHKKARVALARKLAVRAAYAAPPARRSALTLHRMLVSGEAFRWPPKEEGATA